MTLEEFNKIVEKSGLSNENPYDHAALCLALRNFGHSTDLHKYEILVSNGKDSEIVPGLAVEIDGDIFTISGCKGWDEINNYESSLTRAIYSDFWGKGVSTSFSHKKVNVENVKIDISETVSDIINSNQSLKQNLKQCLKH